MASNLLSELTNNIDEIKGHLEHGNYQNEYAVRIGIVDPLLRILGWKIGDPTIVKVEYMVEGRRVDYALCNLVLRPLVFIEAKSVGKIDEGQRQLVEYAYYEDIPIAILTDGERWRFYAAGGGNYKERLVQELNLRGGDAEENAKSMIRYLSYDAVCSGESSAAIRADYERVLKDREVEKRLPEVWRELLQEKDDALLLTIIEKSQEKGIDPTVSQIFTFLESLEVKDPTPLPVNPQTSRLTKRSNESHLRVTMSDGEVIENQNSRIVFTTIIEKIGLEDVMRIEPKIVSRTPFPKGNFQSGQYYINTNNGNRAKASILNRISKKLEKNLEYQCLLKSVELIPNRQP